MRKRFASAWAFGLMAAVCHTVPAAAQEDTKILFTPRLWYSFISSAERLPTGAGVLHTPVPLYGGTLAVVPAGMGGTTYSLTAFYGTGNGDYQEGDGTGGGAVFTGGNDLKRLDIEGVAQFPIGNSGAYWSLGLRYVKTDSETDGRDQFNQAFNFVAH